MILLMATPINNSAAYLENLISLFTGTNELRNKASLDCNAIRNDIDLATERKRIVAGKEEASEEAQRQLTEQFKRHSEEFARILDEVMVLRTRKHVTDKWRTKRSLR